MSDYKGYSVTGTMLKNKHTKSYDTVYILKDNNKVIGIFDDVIYADRYWNFNYLPSKRKEVINNDTYEERQDERREEVTGD